MLMEKVVYDHLRNKLPCPVGFSSSDSERGPWQWDDFEFFDQKTNEDTRLVCIERVGGSSDPIKRGSFAIQSYGSSLLEACELNELVKEAMESLIEDENVSKVDLDGDYNFTDIERKRHRYQAVFDVFFY